jgi:release factor glutamine methyltransferase
MNAPAAVDVGGALAWARGKIAAVDARVLLRHVCRCSSAHLVAWPEETLDEAAWGEFRALTGRRAAGEPVAYLVGAREFYGRVFRVDSHVLIPRSETELLVELALAHFAAAPPPKVLDLGTGSGVLAITLALELNCLEVTAVDRSRDALIVAAMNAFELGAKVTFAHGNWYGALDGVKFQLIVANPPYVPAADPHLDRGDPRFEPRMALASGVSGLDDIALIVAGARHHLEKGAWLFMEHGHDQAGRVRALLTDAGFAAIASWRDLAGIERVSGGQWRG